MRKLRKYLYIYFVIYLGLEIYNLRKNNNNILRIFNKIEKHYHLNFYRNYINSCRKLKRINNNKNIYNNYPFISVCITVYNLQNYIAQALLSIINQSFQDFEIIIINDFSTDNTSKIIRRFQKKDKRIRIFNHINNLGTYHSRVDAVLNSRGNYILFLDIDDMILNPNLFKILYYYYLYYNLDIIEFTVYHQIEKKKHLFYPKEHFNNHNHKYKKKIIYQPELSNTIFYEPNTNNYNFVICRTLWNKLFKKKILLKSINYIGKEYYQNCYIIVVEDILLNIINFHFSNNYTNINIPGYMYNIREFSISHKKINEKVLVMESISFYLYFKLLFKYIKDYDKDRNYLYYELKYCGMFMLNLKKYNLKDYLQKIKYFFNEILDDKKTSIKLKNLIEKFIMEIK